MSGVSIAGGHHESSNSVPGAVELCDSGGRALKLQTDTPHLVSMGGDRLSTSVTLHPIPQGRVTLGSGQGVDISVQGTGVQPLHCHIENSEGVVTIYPLCENLSIDGIKVSGPTRLSQGVMLTIGRSNYMRFNHPAEAKLMKSVLPNPRISMAPIYFEPESSFESQKFNKKPPVAPRKSPRESFSDSGSEDMPSSIMTKVSKFEYLAAQNFKKSISPKVFSSNLVTVNTPAKDVLGKSPPDLNSFSKNLPQSALNYSELNCNEKQHNKGPTAEKAAFNRKHQPQYVNVTVNETKNINNRVFIYENGCTSKNQNFNFDHNELNNKSSSCTKNINVSRVSSPSPSFNRNPTTPYYRSVTSSPVSMNVKVEHRRSDSMGELSNDRFSSLDDVAQRKYEAETRRSQAHQDRIKEQEMGKAEQQRLEEILNMCAEYEKQTHTEKQKPTPPKKPVRLKNNGSLPKNKSQPSSPSYSSTPPQSPLEALHNELLKQNNHNYENHVIFTTSNINYENVEIRTPPNSHSLDYKTTNSPYENVFLQNSSNQFLHTRSKSNSYVGSNKDVLHKVTTDLIDNKFAILEAEQLLLQEAERLIKQNRHNSKEIPKENQDFLDLQRKSTPTKFILPLEDMENFNKNCPSPYENKIDNSFNNNLNSSDYSKLFKTEEELKRVDKLRKEKKEILAVISRIKRQMAEIEIQEEELHREIELERALLSGELKSKQLEIEKIEIQKEKLLKRAHKIENNMRDGQEKQKEDQEQCKIKLKCAQEHMAQVDAKLAQTSKTSEEYEKVFEEYLQAQEQLDNERKTFEDLEFHHLEEEADWLASREELQREVADLNVTIDTLQANVLELDQQKNDISKNNTSEFKCIEKQKIECYMRLEEIRNRLKLIDSELMSLSNQESEQEVSSDSESDRSKDLDRHLSNISLHKITDMSSSIIVSSQRIPEHASNMSQSFNEKLLQEKSILEIGSAKRFPSQDDIDRISKVTSNAPINIDEGQGSLNKKTIESLKELERRRHLHLCQQGSQVIEQERQRVQALKQRVQEEVRNKWAQRVQEDSIISTDSEPGQTSINNIEMEQKVNSEILDEQAVLNRSVNPNCESPRPLSETSEMSLEVGTLNRKRTKTPSDKQRPLTRYLPIRGSDLDLRQHIESAGHQVVLCPHVLINSASCRGFLHKKGSKLNGWSKRWFVFDRTKHTFSYYSDKSEKKPRGGAYFQAIEEVYLDHLNTIKSPNPHLTFIVKTHERHYYLMAPSPEAMRIWVDVIFTGAEGYREFEHGT